MPWRYATVTDEGPSTADGRAPWSPRVLPLFFAPSLPARFVLS
jgi:hypothetical protein